MRLATLPVRAKAEEGPRTAQFVIERRCRMHNPGSQYVLTCDEARRFPFPLPVWVYLEKVPNLCGACMDFVYALTEEGKAIVEKATGRRLPPSQVVICERAGRLIE